MQQGKLTNNVRSPNNVFFAGTDDIVEEDTVNIEVAKLNVFGVEVNKLSAPLGEKTA